MSRSCLRSRTCNDLRKPAPSLWRRLGDQGNGQMSIEFMIYKISSGSLLSSCHVTVLSSFSHLFTFENYTCPSKHCLLAPQWEPVDSLNCFGYAYFCLLEYSHNQIVHCLARYFHHQGIFPPAKHSKQL